MDALEPQLGGIGRYTWELCKGLERRSDIEDLRFYARNSLISDPALLLSAQYRHPPSRRWPFASLQRRRLERILGSHLVHGPNYFLPDGVERGVITAHDLSVFRFPETHPAERVRQFEQKFQSSVDRSAHVITDTETVRRELIDDFGLQPDRVTAVLLGVESKFRPRTAEDVQPQLSALGLQAGSYALCVSTLEPRKKIAELLTAWEALPRSLRDRVPLVLAGGAGWRNESLREAVDRGVAQGWLKHLGFVDEAAMPALYAGARLFIYPSIYEGFGLPPLEAMASGVQAMVSNRSCLPEVGGDAALYIDPDDILAFTRAIEEALDDENGRQTCVQRGLARAAEFTWARCIEGTVGVYRTALAQG